MNKFWEWACEGPLQLTVIVLFCVIFIWAVIAAPEDHARETSNYEQLLLWSEIPELKADIRAAWANGWISIYENKAIVKKHGNLDEMRAKKKFESKMTEQHNKAWEATE